MMSCSAKISTEIGLQRQVDESHFLLPLFKKMFKTVIQKNASADIQENFISQIHSTAVSQCLKLSTTEQVRFNILAEANYRFGEPKK